jgi:RNA polymerase sigma-70 factor (ECF subfamily)
VANASEAEREFERLFLNEYRHVLAYALRRTSSLADAQDAVAETFTVAWRKIADAPYGDAVRPWLYAIAFRAISNQRRSERRLSALRGRHRSQRPSPRRTEETLESRHEWDSAVAALARLSSKDQEVLRLAAWEDLSHRDIGEVLGCSENAAAIRLHRARRRLLEELAKEELPAGRIEVETLKDGGESHG